MTKIREFKVINFTGDVFEVLKRHQKYDPSGDAWPLVKELVQICCGLAFEFKGIDAGKEELFQYINECYEYAKNNP